MHKNGLYHGFVVFLLMAVSFAANAQEYSRGDVDQDGKVSITDVTCLSQGMPACNEAHLTWCACVCVSVFVCMNMTKLTHCKTQIVSTCNLPYTYHVL